jgi:hypothetical protein
VAFRRKAAISGKINIEAALDDVHVGAAPEVRSDDGPLVPIISSVFRPKWLGALAVIGMLASALALAVDIHGQVLTRCGPTRTSALASQAAVRRAKGERQKSALGLNRSRGSKDERGERAIG